MIEGGARIAEQYCGPMHVFRTKTSNGRGSAWLLVMLREDPEANEAAITDWALTRDTKRKCVCKRLTKTLIIVCEPVELELC